MAVDHSELVGLLLASSAQWQTLTAAADATAALAFIHVYELEEDDTRPSDDADVARDPFPRACVIETQNTSQRAALDLESRSGTLSLVIELEPPADKVGRKTQFTWFRNAAITLRSEMLATSLSRATAPGKSHTHLYVKQMTFEIEPHHVPALERAIDEDEAAAPAALWRIVFRIEW
jgi:hypothetical protein